LLDVADRLSDDPDAARGRPAETDERVARALDERDARAIDEIADTYDQAVPERPASERLRALASGTAPIVGYLGKLIPQKGVELLLAAQRRLSRETDALIVGFGSYREWLAALAIAVRRHDEAALTWLRGVCAMPIGDAGVAAGAGAVTFTGRLDHRYAPGALAAMDVLVVPSILEEAFGMVAAEGAAAGALPLVARHSGLAEVAAALESEVGRPGLFSFEPASVDDLATSLDRLLAMPSEERDELGAGVSAFVHREWTWDRTAARILATW
jgi:glycosyltransferase involved in cell wall biosynthesis